MDKILDILGYTLIVIGALALLAFGVGIVSMLIDLIRHAWAQDTQLGLILGGAIGMFVVLLLGRLLVEIHKWRQNPYA